MNKTNNINYIRIALICFAIIFIILILWIMDIYVKNNEKKSDQENNNTNSSKVNIRNVEESDEQVENEMPLFYDSEEDGESQNARNSYEILDKMYELNIKNIPNEVLEQIKDKDSFRKDVKRYIYLRGLMDETTEAQFYQTTSLDTLEENEIAMIFILNNKENTTIEVRINNKTGNIKIDEVFE